MNPSIYSLFLIAVFLTLCFGSEIPWLKIDQGLDWCELPTSKKATVGNSLITVIRIDPRVYALQLLCVSEQKNRPLSAPEWAKKHRLLGVINAGMYLTDYVSNVGYMKNYTHLNNKHINKKYFSVAAFNPVEKKDTPFRIFDIDTTPMKEIITRYQSIIQNLRLIKRVRNNRWEQQGKIWSEAALGEDSNGNILFIFSRSPWSMHDFNDELLQLPIQLVCAQHLEGGHEASLYFDYNGVTIKRVGSFATDFQENDDNSVFFPIPNVIGIVKR